MWALINLAEWYHFDQPEKIDFVRDERGDVLLFDTAKEAREYHHEHHLDGINPAQPYEIE